LYDTAIVVPLEDTPDERRYTTVSPEGPFPSCTDTCRPSPEAQRETTAALFDTVVIVGVDGLALELGVAVVAVAS
jgi:hypothetical protein